MTSLKIKNSKTLYFKIAITLLLPCFLVFLGIDSHFQIRKKNKIFKIQQDLEKKIEILAKYSQEKVYFHALFDTILQKIDNSKTPLKKLQAAQFFLKKYFKKKIKFIVWNNNGKINKKLTDEKKYQYVLKTAFNVFSTLKNNFTKIAPIPVNKIRLVQNKLELLRRYFGKFLSLKVIADPLKLEKVIISSIKSENHFFWYQIYENFTIAILLDRSFPENDFGKRNIVKNFNKRKTKTKLGFINLITKKIYPEKAYPRLTPELLISSNHYLQSGQPFQETKNSFAYYQQVSPKILCFSFSPKDSLPNYTYLRNKWFFTLGKFIFIGAYLLIIFFKLRAPQNISVRFRIFSIFILASILPLVIIISIGFEYLQYKEYFLINQIQNDSVDQLREIDLNFPIWRDKTASEINRFIAEKEKLHNFSVWTKTSINSLATFLKRYSPDELYLINNKNQALFRYNLGDSNSSNLAYLSQLYKILQALNSTKQIKESYINTSLKAFATERELLFEFLNQLGKIHLRSLGIGIRWSYTNILGNRKAYKIWGVIGAAWKEKNLQEKYLKDVFSSPKLKPKTEIYMAQINQNELFSKAIKSSHIKRLLEKTHTSNFKFKSKVKYKNKNYIFSSVKTENLKETVLGCLYPMKPIRQAISSLKYIATLILLILILFSSLIIWFYSGLLIKPLNQLETGIKKISEYKLSFKIQPNGNDEFSDLINTFNSAISGLQDLNVATLIQESLLPNPYFESEKFQIIAKSKFMSKMGGDYFDYYSPCKDNLTLVFGDVAGHGIPAALIMAMVKAVIANNNEKLIPTSLLLAKTNEIFLHLKKQKWRRMMTFQCFNICIKTGLFSFANAGHCYPILINRNKKISYLKSIGMPLGTSKKNNWNEISQNLEEGDKIILYSDGFIEATNKLGNQLGLNGFERIIVNSYSRNIRVFHENIFENLGKQTGQQDDDLSLLILNYGEAGQ